MATTGKSSITIRPQCRHRLSERGDRHAKRGSPFGSGLHRGQVERPIHGQFASDDVVRSDPRGGVDAHPAGGVSRAQCDASCRWRSDPRPTNPHRQGAASAARPAMSSESTTARCQSICAVRNRARTNAAATGQARRRSTESSTGPRRPLGKGQILCPKG